MSDRKILFGKYKGQTIKMILLTHIGYIMWCLENIKSFRLNNEEQAIYDAIAIMIKKYDIPTTFPVNLLYKHIKDLESFNKLNTPFVFSNGYIAFHDFDKDNFIVKSISNYITTEITNNVSLGDVMKCINKDIITATDNIYSNEKTCEGWREDAFRS